MESKYAKIAVISGAVLLLILLLLVYVWFSVIFENFTKINGLEKKGKLIFYHADWCGHCQNVKPEWEKIKLQYGNTIDFADYEHKQIPKETLKHLYAFPTIYYDDYAQKKIIELNSIHDLTKLI